MIPIPADFPGQLYIRRAIVQKLMPGDNSNISSKITNLVPFLGPLHLSLNTRESVFLVFWPFFDLLYRKVFGKKKKLANKPKPWRINLLLFMAHSGWQMIKKYVVTKFGPSKSIGYITFFDLLDNLVPATLEIYATLFRGNHLIEYVDTVYRLWSVMKRFNRHNYDKILLAFLSDFQYWKLTSHPIMSALRNNLNLFDEYPIENFHSRLRRHTTSKVNTAKSIRRDALFVDKFQHENSFSTAFSPKKNYPYKKKDLDELAKQTAIFLLEFFNEIWKCNGNVKEKKEKKKIYYYFPSIPSPFMQAALPLGYHSSTPPNVEKFCDHVGCLNPSNQNGQVLICGHAFHEECFKILGLHCEHCFKYLSASIDDLTSSYNNRLQMKNDTSNKSDFIDPTPVEDCDVDEAETVSIRSSIDEDLRKKIKGIVIIVI